MCCLNCVQDISSLTICGHGVTRKDAVRMALRLIVVLIVTLRLLVTAEVFTVNVPVVCPSAIVMLLTASCAVGLLDESATLTPPAPAAHLSVTVPITD